MRVRVKTKTYSINIELSPAFVKDIIPLFRQGGDSGVWTLSQRQTFNSLAYKLEEVLKVTESIDAESVLQ